MMTELYLLKSACWLSGFAVVYFLFLRNERFFVLKRIYLLSGLILSFALPLVTFHYEVPAPSIPQPPSAEISYYFDQSAFEVQEQPAPKKSSPLLIIYIAGVLVLSSRLLWHMLDVSRTIRNSKLVAEGPAKVVRAEKISSSFSYFSYIFINQSVDEKEFREIINHELVHVGQKHWIDLVLVELVRIIQWANPLAWIYTGFVRMNHEYLADSGALRKTTDPALYKAALLNQMFRTSVLSLTNSFNYCLNKNRFEMMKKVIASPYRKFKTLLIVPLSAVIFYAFAEPVYVEPETAFTAATSGYFSDESYAAAEDIIPPPVEPVTAADIQKGEIKGTVRKPEGGPFAGVNVAVTRSAVRVRTDENGNFAIPSIPGKSNLVFSATGYKTRMLKPRPGNMEVVLEKDPDYKPNDYNLRGYNPNEVRIRPSSDSMLVVIDGVVFSEKGEAAMRQVKPDEINTVSVLKGESALRVFGEKAKRGAIIITTKKNSTDAEKRTVEIVNDSTRFVSSSKEVPFVVVEEMPMYTGGDEALLRTIRQNTIYPESALLKGIEGRVILRFVVTAEGKVDDIKVLKSVDPDLDREAVRVVATLGEFSPGRQGGKAVPVYYMVPVTFSLPLFTKSSEEILLRFIATNTGYPAAARSSAVAGKIFTRVKIAKGGVVQEATITGKETKVPQTPEIVIVGYKTAGSSDIQPSPGGVQSQGNISLLEAECLRVVNMVGNAGIPEFLEKDMEFIIPFNFTLK